MNRENDSYSSILCKSPQKSAQKWDDTAVQPTSDWKLLLSVEPLEGLNMVYLLSSRLLSSTNA